MDFKKYFELIKSKVFPGANAPEAAEALDEEDEILRRRQPNKAMIVTGVSALAIVVMILSSLPNGDNNGTAANTQVLSGNPQMASISNVITGAGTLAPGETEKVALPEVIDLEKYYVHNGDKVLVGDVLASVDKIQVAAAIAELQDVMNTLDKDINTASSKTDSTSIKSGVSGRVKAIFAKPGDDVSEVVYENGCLMLLSLDGMMSVTFPAEGSAQLGQVVDVTLSDGATETGRVYSVTDGKITVTITDVGAPYGDQVTVKDLDGKRLGSGELDIHSPLQISGYYGTVASVGVKLNQKVSNSTQLITLKEPGHTAEYTALLKRRGELSEQMDALYAMSDGFIHATKDGIVSAIPDDAQYANADELAEIAPVAFSDEFANVKLDWLVGDGNANLFFLAAGDIIPTGPFEVTGNLVSVSATGTYVLSGTSKPADSGTLFDTYMVGGSADCMFFNYNGFVGFRGQQMPTAMLAAMFPQVSGFGTIKATVKFNVVTSGDNATLEVASVNLSIEQNRSININFPFSFGSSAQKEKVYDTYSTDTETIMELVPLDELTITISVDELDILRLKEGMAADITMDAFPGTTFPGTITRVGAFGVNSGGNAKYDVKVSLHTTEQMLVGMNASLSIITDRSEELLTIPAAAIVEENGKTWVYTKYDKSKDVLTGLTEITTGMSDGELVQIVDGLNENSTFYYRYADRLIYSFV